MATTLYRSALWHVQSFGTEPVTSIAWLGRDGSVQGVWIIENKRIVAQFPYLLTTWNEIDGNQVTQHSYVDAFLSGFTLAAPALGG